MIINFYVSYSELVVNKLGLQVDADLKEMTRLLFLPSSNTATVSRLLVYLNLFTDHLETLRMNM